ncbi:hypothetical protein ROZALSC1DRAFT_23549, partial [Rozella allomycis CSF55]
MTFGKTHYYYANWCAACNAFKSEYEKIDKNLSKNIKRIKNGAAYFYNGTLRADDVLDALQKEKFVPLPVYFQPYSPFGYFMSFVGWLGQNVLDTAKEFSKPINQWDWMIIFANISVVFSFILFFVVALSLFTFLFSNHKTRKHNQKEKLKFKTDIDKSEKGKGEIILIKSGI